ncbi:MAG TPA: TlpA disulfide reductase family protein [Thiobacillaceae bacterium]|nr:TlpA disulfide reductase family protein [Thiobacillaceae bacterium]
MRSHRLLIGLAAVAALVGGLLVSTRLHEPNSKTEPGGEILLAAAFKDLNGQRQPLSQWRGKALVVNFWATWCPPCRAEIPGFIELHRELAGQGVQFVGIAIDQGDKVRDFARELGVNYPLLIGEGDALELQRELGNQTGGLPFTVVLDFEGRLVTQHQGGFSAKQLRGILLPLARRS